MIQRVLRAALQQVRSNETISNLLQDITNEELFNSLFRHEQMLTDSARVDTYAAAIRRHVEPDDVVVDLGTGTGILALLAAREGATVYAIDHADVIDVAEMVASHNDIETVEFRQVNSRNFTCPEAVDVVLHEQMGSALFTENMVENLLDMKRRLLGETGTILPGRFELFLEPAALEDEYRVPFLRELSVQGIDYGFPTDRLQNAESYTSGGYSRAYFEPHAFDFLLSRPEPILTFDLNELPAEDAIPTTLTASRAVVNPGRMDGFCLYFRAIFDEDVHLDTIPTEHTVTSWHNALFRTPRTEYDTGDEISYTVTLDELSNPDSWSISLDSDETG